MEILYMHELTLLFGVAEQVGRVAKENNIDHVDAVVLEIGELTTVVPEFMMDGYPVISDEYDFLRGSELIIATVPAIGHCNECGAEFALDENEGRCPACDSSDRIIVSGNDFIIKEIRVAE